MTTILALCDPAEDLEFIEVHHRASALEQRRQQESEQRRILAEIRERYRRAPSEDVDDSKVVGFGNRVSTDASRPPRRSSSATR
jgi:transcription elongation GreA/GreB family factor